MDKKFIILIGIFLSITTTILCAANTKYGIWGALQLTDNFENSKYLYDLEFHARFKSVDEFYDKTILRGGLGYDFNNLSALIGFDYHTPTKVKDVDSSEYRFWQQLKFGKFLKNFEFVSRTRLEERINSKFSGVSLRLRERLIFKSSNPIIWELTPIFYEELFINFNKVNWMDTEIFNQNRAFFGFDIPFNLSTLQVGYINQLKFKTKQTNVSHILWIAYKF